MTFVSRRVVGAVAVLATLALSACAVPGQGDPGVAATYEGRTVTNQQVLDMDQAYADLGTASTSIGEPLTMLVLGPDLIAQAEKLGMKLSDEKIKSTAEAWIAYNNNGGTVTPEALSLVQDLYALFYLLTSNEGAAALNKLGSDAEAGVVASPRYGGFVRAHYVQTVTTALNDITSNATALGTLLFVPLKQVSGFSGPSPSWVSGG